MTVETFCRECGRSYPRYNSLQTRCGLCLYNKYEKPKKPMKKIGKVTKKWIDTRQEWIDKHPEPWTCYLCGRLLDIDTLTLDHIKSRTRRPDLRYTENNLAPCCWPCNEAKGSKGLDEL